MTKIERLPALNESGAQTEVVRITPESDASNLRRTGAIPSLAALETLDGERLRRIGEELVGIESGRKFRLI